MIQITKKQLRKLLESAFLAGVAHQEYNSDKSTNTAMNKHIGDLSEYKCVNK